ncbi:collectin-12-like [Bactrocera oleae]|uniref:collectin-12-like n=1 Tax=Bactrocera oleae TaxID=104688 RepID=UPI00387E37DB
MRRQDICFVVLFGMLQVLALARADGEDYTYDDEPLRVRIGKTELLVWNMPLDWQSAYEFCENDNSNLVVLNNREKIVKLQLFLIKNRENRQLFAYWIGGNDLEELNKWKWIPINKPFTYTHWLDGEPKRSSSKRCVGIDFPTLGRWHNSPCSHLRNFICERNI